MICCFFSGSWVRSSGSRFSRSAPSGTEPLRYNIIFTWFSSLCLYWSLVLTLGGHGVLGQELSLCRRGILLRLLKLRQTLLLLIELRLECVDGWVRVGGWVRKPVNPTHTRAHARTHPHPNLHPHAHTDTLAPTSLSC